MNRIRAMTARLGYGLAVGALLVAALAPAMISTSAANGGKIIRVPQDFPTVGGAVAAAQPYDFILIGPGTYHEAVRVTVPHLTIRGVNRDQVVFDGDNHALPSAITVDGANGVDLGNMTAHGYSDNGFWWDKVTGYRGTFLTAYDNRGYGIYAFRSTVGEFSYSYASQNGDSGFYIGACFDCKAVITNVHAQNNGLGYSGTNAGGILIQESEWDNNLVGIIPNTLPTEDNSPQGGKVGVVITNNYVHDNNNSGAPSTFALAGPVGSPTGYGISLAGGWNNQVIRNRVVNHKHYGIAVHYLTTPTIGNQVEFNDVSGSGDADIAWDGIGASNCFQGNLDEGKPAIADPPTLETTNSCGLASAPVGGSPLVAIRTALSAAGIGDPRSETAQPPPGPQAGMPDPCAGAPGDCGSAKSTAAFTPATESRPPAPPSDGYTPIQSLQKVAEGLEVTPTQADVRRSLADAFANIARADEPLVIPASPIDTNGYLATAMGVAALFFLVGAGLGYWRHLLVPQAAPAPPSAEPAPPPPRRTRKPK